MGSGAISQQDQASSGAASISSVPPGSSESPQQDAPQGLGMVVVQVWGGLGAPLAVGSRRCQGGFAPCVVLGMCRFLFCFRAVGVCQQCLFECTDPPVLQPAVVV